MNFDRGLKNKIIRQKFALENRDYIIQIDIHNDSLNKPF